MLGYKTVDKLSEEEKAMTAQELMEYLSRAKGFAIGHMHGYPEDQYFTFYCRKRLYEGRMAADGDHPVCHESDLLPKICGNYRGNECQRENSCCHYGEFRSV